MMKQEEKKIKRIRFIKRKLKEILLTKYFETGDKKFFNLAFHL
jgi:hypothetical protein